MVKVNGQDSRAHVVTVETDADGTSGTLFIDLYTSVSEIQQWKTGQKIHIEATWQPNYILFPIHETLLPILGSSSVQGSFFAHTYIIGTRLVVLLQSTRELRPLER